MSGIEMENPTQIIREILVRQQIISTVLVILMAVMAGLAGWILWEAARDRRRREREQQEWGREGPENRPVAYSHRAAGRQALGEYMPGISDEVQVIDGKEFRRMTAPVRRM